MQHWHPLLVKLQRFKQLYGHFEVPIDWPIDPQLSQWVINLRAAGNQLPAELRKELRALHFDWQARDPWQLHYEQLRAFVQQYGLVPADSAAYPHLSDWIRLQRQAQSLLSDQQVNQLDALGFDWQLQGDDQLRWQARYQQLMDFQQRFGHTRVPETTPEYPGLSGWVLRQRKIQRQGQLAPCRVAQLNELGFKWGPDLAREREQAWQERFGLLRLHYQQNGSLHLAALRKTDSPLALWVTTQQRSFARHTLTQARKKQLATLEFPFEKPHHAATVWERQYEALKAFCQQQGHCRPTPTTADPVLCHWVRRQRQRPDRLSQEQRTRLDALGFLWANQYAQIQWNQHYQLLQQFVEVNGHGQVPKASKALYQWLADQKKSTNSLTADQREKLAAIPGFRWAHALFEEKISDWNQQYAQFIAFQRRHGPQYLLHLAENAPLHYWVKRQLHNQGKMPAYKRVRLEAISFPWQLKEAQVDQRWDQYYRALEAFQHTHGHCLVPPKDARYQTLAGWVARQRQADLSPEKKQRLDQLGFCWKHGQKQDRWQQRLEEATRVWQAYGYLKVPSQCPLGSWLYQQKKHFARLSLVRQQALLALGLVPLVGAESPPERVESRSL